MATRIAGAAAMMENNADDAHMQPGAGAAAAARLHHLPDLAHDDAEQQQHRHRIGEQQRDHDVVGRQERGQVGKDDEGDKGRQQSQADRDRAEHPRFRPLGRRMGERGFGAGSLFDAHGPLAAAGGAQSPLNTRSHEGLARPPRH